MERVERDAAGLAIGTLAEDGSVREMVLVNQLELGGDVERSVLDFPCKERLEEQCRVAWVLVNPIDDFFARDAASGEYGFHV